MYYVRPITCDENFGLKLYFLLFLSLSFCSQTSSQWLQIASLRKYSRSVCVLLFPKSLRGLRRDERREGRCDDALNAKLQRQIFKKSDRNRRPRFGFWQNRSRRRRRRRTGILTKYIVNSTAPALFKVRIASWHRNIFSSVRQRTSDKARAHPLNSRVVEPYMQIPTYVYLHNIYWVIVGSLDRCWLTSGSIYGQVTLWSSEIRFCRYINYYLIYSFCLLRDFS